MKKLFLAFLPGVLFFASSALGQKDISIAQVQGETNISQYNGQSVRVSGIVTARLRSGFFIQTPDDKVDANPKTSEGIYIYTRTEPSADAAVGNTVSVTGSVEEFRRDNEPLSLTITEISMRAGRDEIRVGSKSNLLPKAAVLTVTDFMANSIDQLEKYEGMRVQIGELVVVAPTGGRIDSKTGFVVSDGAFFGVLKAVPRPFREPGMDIREYISFADKDKLKRDFPKLPIFDSNPEIIRIDSDEQIVLKTEESGRAVKPTIDVATQTEVKNLVGVLHYTNGKYTLLTDPGNQHSVSNSIKPNLLPIPTERQFSVAGMNLENFFDDQDDPEIKEDVVSPELFQRRLKKLSRAIRDFMQSPDIIGVTEVENLAALKRLAAAINSDAVAAGKPDPKYEAYLVDGNDGRGIDNGFLVKTLRVKVSESKQLGKNDKYKNPNTKDDIFLNDRPPLMLRASIDDPKTSKPFEFTVLVNHMKSFLGYNDPKQQDNVRIKKRLQAEFLARFVQERQKAAPNERIILLGDFNAFQFNDGIVDMIGTIKGKPAPKPEVLNPSEDLVDPDLINLVDVIDFKQRYSYSFDGNAQVLDHIIINEVLRKHTSGFGYARLNADFPQIYRNDATRLERFSDHDPAVAYFTFDDMTAPKAK
ncbi:MAG: hypothetical protein ACR2M8_01995 [Pyrinomonadaceae bacterium]